MAIPALRKRPTGVTVEDRLDQIEALICTRVQGAMPDVSGILLDHLAYVRQAVVGRDIPGISRTHGGHAHGRDVSAAQTQDGRWIVSIELPMAFSDKDDVHGAFDTEGEALATVDAFVRTGKIPGGLARREHGSQAQDDGYLWAKLGTVEATVAGDSHSHRENGLSERVAGRKVRLEIEYGVERDGVEYAEDGSVEFACTVFRAKFDPAEWDTARLGHLYGDSGVTKAVNDRLAALGYASKVGWSEAGRQDYAEADFDADYGLVSEVFPELARAPGAAPRM